MQRKKRRIKKRNTGENLLVVKKNTQQGMNLHVAKTENIFVDILIMIVDADHLVKTRGVSPLITTRGAPSQDILIEADPLKTVRGIDNLTMATDVVIMITIEGTDLEATTAYKNQKFKNTEILGQI